MAPGAVHPCEIEHLGCRGTFLSAEHGRNIQIHRCERRLGWDSDSLAGKEENPQVLRGQSLSASQQQTDGCPASPALGPPPPHPPPPGFYRWMWCDMVRNNLWVGFGLLSRLFHSSLLLTPSLLSDGAECETEMAWALCKRCSAAAKTPCVINTALGTDPKHRTIQASVKNINSIPARPGRAGKPCGRCCNSGALKQQEQNNAENAETVTKKHPNASVKKNRCTRGKAKVSRISSTQVRVSPVLFSRSQRSSNVHLWSQGLAFDHREQQSACAEDFVIAWLDIKH